MRKILFALAFCLTAQGAFASDFAIQCENMGGEYKPDANYVIQGQMKTVERCAYGTSTTSLRLKTGNGSRYDNTTTVRGATVIASLISACETSGRAYLTAFTSEVSPIQFYCDPRTQYITADLHTNVDLSVVCDRP